MAPKRKKAEKVEEKAAAEEEVKATEAASEADQGEEKKGDEKPEKKKAKAVLAVGDEIPDVELEQEDGIFVKLTDLVTEKGAVIFMYPKANTGGCTKQACGFKDNYSQIVEAGYDVYGLSFDKPKSQSNWKTKYSLPYHLLTDSTGEVIKAFGAAKGAKSILRSHVVVAKGGKLLDIRNGISPGDSFAEAVKTVTKKDEAPNAAQE